MNNALMSLVEKGLVPDALVRMGIRSLCRRRIAAQQSLDPEQWMAEYRQWVDSLKDSPVALVPEKANEQHYEVPPEFFFKCLGRHLKYSCCEYRTPDDDLDTAEANMLERTCERAGIEDGMAILELGCGWGSLTHWMASHYPNSPIVAVSNSAPQRETVLRRCAEAGRGEVEVITADMNDFSIDRRFDRVVSVEMFEHMRNWQELFARVASWLNDDGRFFMHVFCHREQSYPFELDDGVDWMARYFFSGGMMPSETLPLNFQRDLLLERQWRVDGTHYARTSRHWLEKMDANRAAIVPLFEQAYGAGQSNLWIQRWRLFYMACEELFALNGGREWFVAHYLMRKR